LSSPYASATKLFEDSLRTFITLDTLYQVIGLALVVIAAMWILGPRAGDPGTAKDPRVGRIMVGAPVLVVLMFLFSLHACDVGPGKRGEDATTSDAPAPRAQGQPEAPQAASQTVRPTEKRTPQPQPKTVVTREAAAKTTSTEASTDNRNLPGATEGHLINQKSYTIEFKWLEHTIDDFNKITIQRIYRESLIRNSSKIRIVGNDETNGESYSDALSRANAVRGSLIAEGLDQDRISIGASGRNRSEDAVDCKVKPLSNTPKRAVVVFLCE
jgi:outer membrane protein OmpA-like peptidoglycan-associated protein